MGLTGSMFTSVSGLNAASTGIEVAGDNIANVNTPGFKERRAEFADVLGQSIASVGGISELGAGTRIAKIGKIMSQGAFESSARTTDVAIQGRGFFVLDGTTGQSYTRAGQFVVDASGFLVTSEGRRVQGGTITLVLCCHPIA